MKKLLYLMLFVLFIQCENKVPKENCGIVTEMVNAPVTDSKSKKQTVPISSYSCEYVVIMPQNKDSFEVQKYLIDNGLVLQKVSESNSAVGLYSKGGLVSGNADSTTTPPIKGPPPPPIKTAFFRNSIVVDPFGQTTTQFKAMSQVGVIQKQ
jgi:hypothetical protein